MEHHGADDATDGWHERQDAMIDVSLKTLHDIAVGDDALLRALMFVADEVFYSTHILGAFASWPADAPIDILDLGCGDGRVAQQLALLFPSASVLGVDDNDMSLAASAGQPLPPNVRFRKARIDGSVDLGTFDLVVCSEVYEHVMDTSGLLRLLQSLVRPGGVLLFSTPSTWMMWVPRLSVLRQIASSPSLWLTRARPDRDWTTALRHHPGSRWRVLKRALEDAGFEIETRGSSCVYTSFGSRSLLWYLQGRRGHRSIFFAVASLIGRGRPVRSAHALRAMYLFAEGAMNLFPPLRIFESRIMVVARSTA